MSDSNPSPSWTSEDTSVCWELATENTPRQCFASSPNSSAAVLDTVLLMFLDDTDVASWDHVDTFAAIAREYSTLAPREIAGVAGIGIMQVLSPRDPGNPPWTLSNPRNDGEMTLRTWRSAAGNG